MKNLCLILLILMGYSLVSSCRKLDPGPQKDNSQTTTVIKDTQDTTAQQVVPITPALLVGDWIVVNDTTTTTPWGIWEGQPVTGTNYVGKPADYFKFTAGGKLYKSLNGLVDTATYTIHENQIQLAFTTYGGLDVKGLDYNSLWTVYNLSSHTASITFNFISPETVLTHVINLKK